MNQIFTPDAGPTGVDQPSSFHQHSVLESDAGRAPGLDNPPGSETLLAPGIGVDQRVEPPNNNCICCTDIDSILSFDTVRLFYSGPARPDTRRLEPFHEYKSFKTGDLSTTYHYKNLRIRTEERGLFVEGSLPVFRYGQNLYPLSISSTHDVLEEISEVIAINVLNFSVTRLDIAANLRVSNPVPDYFSLLSSLTGYDRRVLKSTLYFQNDSKALLFYDKIREIKAHRRYFDPALVTWMETAGNSNWLRYELQVRKVKNSFKCGLRASQLCDPLHFRRLAAQWLRRYKQIVTNTTSPTLSMRGNGTKAVLNNLIALGIKEAGGYDAVSSSLSQAVKQSRLSSHQASALRRRLKPIVQLDPEAASVLLRDELDAKVMKAYNQALM